LDRASGAVMRFELDTSRASARCKRFFETGLRKVLVRGLVLEGQVRVG